jgi:hypothetical protein
MQKKDLERAIVLIDQRKSEEEIMEELGIGIRDVVLEQMKIDSEKLHGEVDILRERIVKQKETNSKNLAWIWILCSNLHDIL